MICVCRQLMARTIVGQYRAIRLVPARACVRDGLVRRDPNPNDWRKAIVRRLPLGRRGIANVLPCHAATIVMEFGVHPPREEALGCLSRKRGKRKAI